MNSKRNDNIFGISIVAIVFLSGFFANSLLQKVKAEPKIQNYTMKAHRGQNRLPCQLKSNFCKYRSQCQKIIDKGDRDNLLETL